MLQKAIEATKLGPGVTPRDIDRLCDEAIEFGVRAVCVPPIHASRAVGRLQGTDLLTVSVVGFPFGDATPAGASAEIEALADVGVVEVDVVAPLGLAMAAEWESIDAWLFSLGEVVRRVGMRWKLIVETALLPEDVIVRIGRRAVSAGVDWLKTSTGFCPAGGATEEAVRLLRRIAPPDVGVKASGGVRDHVTALRMLAAGADLIGTSAVRAILEPEFVGA